MDLALNNLQRLICHKTNQTNQTKPETVDNVRFVNRRNPLVQISIEKGQWVKKKLI